MANATADQVSGYYQTYLGRAPENSGSISQYTGMSAADAETAIRNSEEAKNRLTQGQSPNTVENTMSGQVNAPSLAAGTQIVPTQQTVNANENLSAPTATGGTSAKATAADVKRMYQLYFGREPDAAGLQSNLAAGLSIADLENSFKNSPEYQQRAAQGIPTGTGSITDPTLFQANASTATAPTAQAAATYGASTVGANTPTMTGAQGQVSAASQVQAAQGTLSAGALAEAQTGTAAQVEKVAPRTVQDGELVSGSAVDQSKIASTDAVAAQGTVSKESTVQGQLEGLMKGFENGQTPAWAAGAMRNAQQILAARGLGASSMAGQAIIQAAMEAATPIAAADAATFAQMGLATLSARQQTALQNAQQRAAFLQQDFDQAFQTRVLNAAKISEIANLNFTAEQTVALEHARLTQQMNLQNLSNRQATAIANAATIASMDMKNLDNRQQAAVVNAQSFLQMDLANLSNAQQAAVINQQSRVQTLLSDQAAQNAAKQFNATSQNQVNQFYDNLASQTSIFNAGQKNAVELANTNAANAMQQFISTQKEQRERFNIENQLVVDQSNVNWRRTVNTQNTAAINAANQTNAQNLLNISNTALNNIWQQFRDEASWANTAGENQANRNYNLAAAAMERDFLTSQMDEAQKNALMQQLGNFGANLVGRAFGA
jgi:hypothetical protein